MQAGTFSPKRTNTQGQLVLSILVRTRLFPALAFKSLGSLVSKTSRLVTSFWILRFLAWIQRYVIRFPDYKAFRLGWSGDLSIPGSPACRWPILEFLICHKRVISFISHFNWESSRLREHHLYFTNTHSQVYTVPLEKQCYIAIFKLVHILKFFMEYTNPFVHTLTIG